MTGRRPRIVDEADYWYLDKLSGRRVAFRPKADEAMVSLHEVTGEDTLFRLVRAAPVRSVSQGANLRRGFAAVYLTLERRVQDLAQLDEIANALSVMVDEEGLARYFVPDELTVQFRDGIDAERAEEIIQRQGSQVLVRQRTPGYYTLLVPEGKGLFATIRDFMELPEVAFAEPSEAGFNDALEYLPEDADFPLLWGMRNTGQTVNGTTGTPGIDIDATRVWDLHRGDPDVIITVVDTGADLDHPDLQANILPRGAEDWDFADTGDPSPDDAGSHGSHVAGTAAAADNAVGVVGVVPQCRIMPLRINLQAGMNQNRADAINYVTQQAGANPARRYVINCSWRTATMPPCATRSRTPTATMSWWSSPPATATSTPTSSPNTLASTPRSLPSPQSTSRAGRPASPTSAATSTCARRASIPTPAFPTTATGLRTARRWPHRMSPAWRR